MFDWAVKAFNEGLNFTAFDIETTGLDPRSDRIVEIGALKFDKKGIIARFSVLINPGIAMPAEASGINHISDEMLKNKPSLDAVMPDFLYFINGTVLAAHNIPFDCGFIDENLKKFTENGNNNGKIPFPSLPNPKADTLAYSREKFPGFRSYSLQNLARELGIPTEEAHRAEEDARICMEVLIRILGL